MPELTDNQIADLRVLQHRGAALGAELVIIGAIAYQIQITWPISQFKMSLVGFDHVFATAQPVQLSASSADPATIRIRSLVGPADRCLADLKQRQWNVFWITCKLFES
jgi:hypothetical protein